jgi:hypothetical protein
MIPRRLLYRCEISIQPFSDLYLCSPAYEMVNPSLPPRSFSLTWGCFDMVVEPMRHRVYQPIHSPLGYTTTHAHYESLRPTLTTSLVRRQNRKPLGVHSRPLTMVTFVPSNNSQIRSLILTSHSITSSKYHPLVFG